jgi:hypothetical protein
MGDHPQQGIDGRRGRQRLRGEPADLGEQAGMGSARAGPLDLPAAVDQFARQLVQQPRARGVELLDGTQVDRRRAAAGGRFGEQALAAPVQLR